MRTRIFYVYMYQCVSGNVDMLVCSFSRRIIIFFYCVVRWPFDKCESPVHKCTLYVLCSSSSSSI